MKYIKNKKKTFFFFERTPENPCQRQTLITPTMIAQLF